MQKTTQYIHQVLNLMDEKAAQEERFLPSDMERLQQALNLEKSDIAYLDTRYAELKQHGEAYFKYKDYTNAIENLSQALALHPFEEKLAFQLAQAEFEQWQISRKIADKQRCKKTLHHYIEISNNDEPAIQLLVQLNKPEPPNNNWQKWLYYIGYPVKAIGKGIRYLFSGHRLVFSANAVLWIFMGLFVPPFKDITGGWENVVDKLGLYMPDKMVIVPSNVVKIKKNDVALPSSANHFMIEKGATFSDASPHEEQFYVLNGATLTLSSLHNTMVYVKKGGRVLLSGSAHGSAVYYEDGAILQNELSSTHAFKVQRCKSITFEK